MTIKNKKIGTPVGILGGGQLARMLAEAAIPMGLDPIAYVESSSTPVSHGGTKTVQAPDLRNFLKGTLLCIFESEFVSCDRLEKASQGLKVTFLPSLKTMRRFQNKINQKISCNQLRIPTAPYEVKKKNQSIEMWLSQVLKKFGGACVLKWGRMGYDGKGVFVLTQNKKNRQAAVAFCEKAVERNIPLYAEEKILFKRELALIGCRSKNGEFVSYPLVVSEQKEGICDRVYGPATRLGIHPNQELKAQNHAKELAVKFDLVGSFGIEFFETQDGELLVNEIAPRVHNTGHYTQDACATSQFENHWRAVLGLALGEVQATPAFAMKNLLGPQGVSLTKEQAVLPKLSPRLHLHWYDKDVLVPHRKLGHLNGSVNQIQKLPELLEKMEECHRDWEKALQLIQKENARVKI